MTLRQDGIRHMLDYALHDGQFFLERTAWNPGSCKRLTAVWISLLPSLTRGVNYSGHTSHVATTYYAIGSTDDLPGTNRNDIHEFMNVSDRWIAFLGFDDQHHSCWVSYECVK
ncbi:hypothetical protein V1509DRAFT_644021 [Lipomyces kononenkoae]